MKSDAKRGFFSVSKSEKLVIVIFSILIFAMFAWNIIPQTQLNPVHRQAELEYMQLHERLQLGMTRADVNKIYKEVQPKLLRLEESKDALSIKTPFQFGARNWVMHLRFADDGLISVKSHIADNDTFPEGSPPDKIMTR